MSGLLLDTNVFNRLLDKNIGPDIVQSKGRLFVTHVQIDELQATHHPERANALLRIFKAIDHEHVPTGAAIWGMSKFGQAEFGDADGLYGSMLSALNSLNNGKKNNAQDVLIAVTAHRRGLILVTDDHNLSKIMLHYGGKVISFDDFMAISSRPHQRAHPTG